MKSLVTHKKDFDAMSFYVRKDNGPIFSNLIHIGFSRINYWKVIYLTGFQAEDKTVLISADEYCGSYANIVPTKNQRIRRQK